MSEDIQNGKFVAAKYESEVYIGKIVQSDSEQYEITFMESGSKIKDCLKWPSREDKIWIDKGAVICIVDEPKPTGKGRRLFKLSDNDKLKIRASKRV